MVTALRQRIRERAYGHLAGYGPVSNGIPEVICGSGDTDVDITRPIRKVKP